MSDQITQSSRFRGSTIISIGVAVVLFLIITLYLWRISSDKEVLEDVSYLSDVDSVQVGGSVSDHLTFTPAAVQEAYYLAIEQLIQELMEQSAQLQTHELLALTEERMLDIRVPHEARDEYIDVFLAIQSLLHETDVVIHDRIVSYLQSLL